MNTNEARAPRAWLMSLVVAISATAIAACAPQNNQALPDEPGTEVTRNPVDDPPANSPPPPVMQEPAPGNESTSATKYSYVDPNNIIPAKLKTAALAYYDTNKPKIANQKYLSIIDFSMNSKKARFFIINMSTGSVWAIHVAHGKGSDPDHDGYAQTFSNSSGSNASSLGYYMTAETYTGSHGYSLRLDGLSSTNSNVRARAIVVHGADYVEEASIIQGRSWGCPAVTMANRTTLINMIKGGSIIFAGRSLAAN